VSASLPLRVVTDVYFAGRVGLDLASRLKRILLQRRRQEGPACYQIDCSDVSGFSEPALVELHLLAEELRDRGSALVLANGCWRSPEQWQWPTDIFAAPRRRADGRP
jgi:anti-anti-sigma regulatory factor